MKKTQIETLRHLLKEALDWWVPNSVEAAWFRTRAKRALAEADETPPKLPESRHNSRPHQ